MTIFLYINYGCRLRFGTQRGQRSTCPYRQCTIERQTGWFLCLTSRNLGHSQTLRPSGWMQWKSLKGKKLLARFRGECDGMNCNDCKSFILSNLCDYIKLSHCGTCMYFLFDLQRLSRGSEVISGKQVWPTGWSWSPTGKSMLYKYHPACNFGKH